MEKVGDERVMLMPYSYIQRAHEKEESQTNEDSYLINWVRKGRKRNDTD